MVWPVRGSISHGAKISSANSVNDFKLYLLLPTVLAWGYRNLTLTFTLLVPVTSSGCKHMEVTVFPKEPNKMTFFGILNRTENFWHHDYCSSGRKSCCFIRNFEKNVNRGGLFYNKFIYFWELVRGGHESVWHVHYFNQRTLVKKPLAIFYGIVTDLKEFFCYFLHSS